MNVLTVSEIEKLAKAGVKIEIGEVSVTQEAYAPTDPDAAQLRYYPLVDAFWARWRRAHTSELMYGKELASFHVCAVEAGDKVQAMICDGEKFVVIEDEKFLYPSDALMVKINLWLETK